jgi:hypothetical protein
MWHDNGATPATEHPLLGSTLAAKKQKHRYDYDGDYGDDFYSPVTHSRLIVLSPA